MTTSLLSSFNPLSTFAGSWTGTDSSFTELTDYLRRLEELRAEAIAATLSMPHGTGEGKRAPKEELDGDQKKKKAKSTSQGVKALEKVNTKGMKDMRSFFAKKAAKAKP